MDNLVTRVLHIEKQFNIKHVEAVAGGVSPPIIMLNDALPKYFELCKDIRLSKSQPQIIKWENPRKLAVRNFIACVGNKPIHELTREDCIKYRDWWIKRIEKQNLSTGTANKHFVYVKSIIDQVNDNYKLGLDLTYLFKRFLFDENRQQRKPFTTEYIRDVLLNPVNLKGMNEVNKSLLEIFAETGVCFAEQISVSPGNIILDDDIPHIIIAPRPKNKLKTKYRERVMPLYPIISCVQG